MQPSGLQVQELSEGEVVFISEGIEAARILLGHEVATTQRYLSSS